MSIRTVFTLCLGAFLGLTEATNSYSEYILAPSSRTLKPQAVYQVNGNVQNAAVLTGAGQGSAVFSGSNASVTYDFGKNIAGNVKFQVDAVSSSNENIGFTFTESSMWISSVTCDATQETGLDLPLWFNSTATGVYEADKYHQRGGFRYLTLVHSGMGSVSLSDLTVYWIAAPEMQDPTAYSGYFHSESEKLNRVWYAGAYTNQLCTIDPTTGSALGEPLLGWEYNYTISNGTSVLVDGAKRDRLVWPGDIVISGPSIFVSTNSLDPIRDGMDSLLALQQPDGRLPYAGDGFSEYVSKVNNVSNLFIWSFTYHLHTLNDIFDYYVFTGDLGYLSSVWDKYVLALNYPLQFIDLTGLAYVTSSADWLRLGMGGHNIEANAILYYTLQNGLKLAEIMKDTSVFESWNSSASGIPPAANNLLWDASASLYRDNDTTTAIHPQDGNSWAIIAGIADSSKADAISTALKSRWGPYGAPAPEAPGSTVSPFASGFELQAHFIAGHADRAVELIESMWADFMLDDPRMTNSTFIEGYSTDGSLHYPAYSNDPRVSHAHGWATGPTSTLSFRCAGLQLTAGGGKTWTVAPAMGGLGEVEAGFQTPLGSFSASWTNGTGGFSGNFETPGGTNGTLELPLAVGASKLMLNGTDGMRVLNVSGWSLATVSGLTGGQYSLSVQ